MTLLLYIQCTLCCLGGNLIHILFKIRSLSIDYASTKQPFNLKIYWEKDKWALLLDLVGSGMLVFIADEIIDSPWIMGKIKLVFILIGIGGSYVVMQLASTAKRQFRSEVKSNKEIVDKTTDEPKL